jgi:hypothetical protein
MPTESKTIEPQIDATQKESIASSYVFSARLLNLTVQSPALTEEDKIPRQSFGNAGREIAAPPWTAACMTDNGPTECCEPMWIYGSPGELVRHKHAFGH